MKRVTVSAYNGIGAKKVFVGSQEIDEPETLAEAIQIEKGEAGVLVRYNGHRTIEVQRKIRPVAAQESKKQVDKLVAFANTLPPTEDSRKVHAALKMAEVSGLIELPA